MKNLNIEYGHSRQAWILVRLWQAISYKQFHQMSSLPKWTDEMLPFCMLVMKKIAETIQIYSDTVGITSMADIPSLDAYFKTQAYIFAGNCKQLYNTSERIKAR